MKNILPKCIQNRYLLLVSVWFLVSCNESKPPNIIYIMLDEIGYYHQVHAHSYYPYYLLKNSEKISLPGNTGLHTEGVTFSQYLIYEETLKSIRENRNGPTFPGPCRRDLSASRKTIHPGRFTGTAPGRSIRNIYASCRS